MSLLIYGAKLLTPDARIEDAAVVIEGDRIVQVGRRDQVVTPPDAEALNAHGLILAPGFIDLQLNGAFGDDFTTTPPAIWRVAARIPHTGVTSFLPTIITSPLEKIEQAQHTLADILALPDGSGAGVSSTLPRAVIVSGLTEAQLISLMNVCKKSGMQPALWACLTPVSETWPLQQLLTELARERQALQKKKSGGGAGHGSPT
jgi:dihydroorotase-like cyclic amidohydrolase